MFAGARRRRRRRPRGRRRQRARDPLPGADAGAGACSAARGRAGGPGWSRTTTSAGFGRCSSVASRASRLGRLPSGRGGRSRWSGGAASSSRTCGSVHGSTATTASWRSRVRLRVLGGERPTGIDVVLDGPGDPIDGDARIARARRSGHGPDRGQRGGPGRGRRALVAAHPRSSCPVRRPPGGRGVDRRRDHRGRPDRIPDADRWRARRPRHRTGRPVRPRQRCPGVRARCPLDAARHRRPRSVGRGDPRGPRDGPERGHEHGPASGLRAVRAGRVPRRCATSSASSSGRTWCS